MSDNRCVSARSSTLWPMEILGAGGPPDRTDVALAHYLERAGEYLRSARAEHTWRAYRSGWSDFMAWGAGHELPGPPAQPATGAAYPGFMVPPGARVPA